MQRELGNPKLKFVYQINAEECAIVLAHCITPTGFNPKRDYD
jgi:hypothetical protein